MTYAANSLPVWRCWRCGKPADVQWCDVRAFADSAPVFIRGRMTCLTPTCVDWDGTNATSETPPSPQGIQDAANKIMDRFWRTMWGATK